MQRLTEASADFQVVGSVARGAREPGDLDITVEAGPNVKRLLGAVGSLGGISTLSAQLPTVRELVGARVWHFETAECALDVFVVDAQGDEAS